MANSRLPGPLNPPMGGVCSIPARTPGTLGHLDQGDPNITTLLGDTPGPLGTMDYADPTLPFWDLRTPLSVGSLVRAPDGTPLAVGGDRSASVPVAKDPALWAAWLPPAGYETLYEMLSENEGNISHMYLDSKNKVTVGIGTYLPSAEDAVALRFYNRNTQALATKDEIKADYKAVLDAKPDSQQFPKGKKAESYQSATKLDMTPSDIGERWLADVKKFQAYLPGQFSGFANYPDGAKQALTDIAYQYGARGAAVNAAGGKLKEMAEKGDWAGAADLCSKLEGSPGRNAKRKELFNSAAKVASRR